MARPLHKLKWLFKFPKLILMSITLVIMGYIAALSLEIYQEKDTHLENRPSYGGTFRIGVHRKPSSLNPVNVSDTSAIPIMHLIFDKLLRQLPNVDLIPSIAREWNLSKNGRTYEFFLREDVYFHDGKQLTSADVLKAFELFSNPKTSPSFSNYFNKVQKFSAPDKFTFKIELKEPYPPFIKFVWQTWVVPSHRINRMGYDQFDKDKNPIGTGPYVFESMSKSGDIVLKANENFREGRPYLDKVEFKVYPSKGHIWAAFMRNELDVVFYMGRRNYEEIKDNEAFKVFKFLPGGGYVLLFNMKNKIMANPAIRTAIFKGINRKEIIEKTEQGEGVVINGPFHPDSWVYNKEWNQDFYEPFEAKRILKEEGFDSKPLSLTILVDQRNQNSIMIARLIHQQLEEVGIKVDLRSYAGSEEAKKLFNEPSEDIHACLMLPNIDIEPNAASRYWESNAPFNLGGYSNSNVDTLFGQARSVSNREDSLKYYQDIQNVLLEEKPAVFLYIPYAYHATAENVHNAEKMFGLYTSIYELTKVYKSSNN